MVPHNDYIIFPTRPDLADKFFYSAHHQSHLSSNTTDIVSLGLLTSRKVELERKKRDTELSPWNRACQVTCY